MLAAAQDQGYEDRLVKWGLELQGRERDPNPEGKVIDQILVSSENIIAPTDPYPTILNIIHVKTREQVIKREVLLQPGDKYNAEVASESERNLRSLFILAVARVVPVKNPIPGHVDILVVTKDLWSIRLNTQFNTVGSLLQVLHIMPTEQNFLGLNQQLSLDFLMKLDTISLGEAFTDSRLFGTRLGISESAAIILNRDTGKSEGSRGGISFGQPLYSLATERAFNISGSWDIERARIYRGADVWQLPFDVSTGATVPYIYDAKDVEGLGSYTLSYGRRFKTNVTFGVGAYTRRFTPPLDLGLSDDQRAFLTANYLPRSEDAVYLLAQLQLYRAEYRVLHNIRTFALSEDFQLGPSLLFSTRYAVPALFSSTQYFEGGTSLGYTFYQWDDLFTATLAARARLLPDGSIPNQPSSIVNRRVAMEVVNYSPVIGPGRFALRGLVDILGQDLNNSRFLLGGGNGLRGTAAESLTGTKRLLWNFEYRTKPLEFHTLFIGGVLFWDAGRVWGNGTTSPFVHTVGIGLRTLFPQFDVATLRIDFGIVLRGADVVGPTSFLDRVSASFGQVFDYRPGFLDSP
jgi:hypothetical protein